MPNSAKVVQIWKLSKSAHLVHQLLSLQCTFIWGTIDQECTFGGHLSLQCTYTSVAVITVDIYWDNRQWVHIWGTFVTVHIYISCYHYSTLHNLIDAITNSKHNYTMNKIRGNTQCKYSAWKQCTNAVDRCSTAMRDNWQRREEWPGGTLAKSCNATDLTWDPILSS